MPATLPTRKPATTALLAALVLAAPVAAAATEAEGSSETWSCRPPDPLPGSPLFQCHVTLASRVAVASCNATTCLLSVAVQAEAWTGDPGLHDVEVSASWNGAPWTCAEDAPVVGAIGERPSCERVGRASRVGAGVSFSGGATPAVALRPGEATGLVVLATFGWNSLTRGDVFEEYRIVRAADGTADVSLFHPE